MPLSYRIDSDAGMLVVVGEGVISRDHLDHRAA
jgi:hypothetical protein